MAKGQAATMDYAQTLFETVPAQRAVVPAPDESQWQPVQLHLTQQLGLPKGLVRRLHQQGLVYAAENGDLVFLQRDLATQAGTGACGQDGGCSGSNLAQGRFYWLQGGQSTDAIRQVVVAQTPLDALALGLMKPMPQVQTMYLSADGRLPIGYLQGFSAKQMIVAMNQDELGQRLAQQAREALPQVQQAMPEQADWIRALQVVQRRAIQRQTKDQAQMEEI